MNNIEIIPAIDLRNGKCVRLYQGDYRQETVFSENPVEVAQRWQSLGASRIHIVDLDGAARGDVVNLPVVEKIVQTIQVPVQLGGGMRSLESISRVLKAGVARVILGTVAVENPVLVREACLNYPGAVIVSIDARDGQVATRGWLAGTGVSAVNLARDMVNLGVPRFIYTDIARDGTLTGPNISYIIQLVQALQLPVIAAGGISNLDDLRALQAAGVEGAIVGKALYTGNIDLAEALKITS